MKEREGKGKSECECESRRERVIHLINSGGGEEKKKKRECYLLSRGERERDANKEKGNLKG